MAIQIRGTALGSDTVDSTVFTLPAGIQQGDLILAFVGTNAAGQPFNTPAGWFAIAANDGSVGPGGGSTCSAAFGRIATGAESGTTAEFTISVSRGGASKEDGLLIVLYSDTPGKLATYAEGSGAVAGFPSAALTQTGPSVDVPSLPAMVVQAILAKRGATLTDLTPDGGFTVQVEKYMTGGGEFATAIATLDASATGTAPGPAWTITETNSTGVGNGATYGLVVAEADEPAPPQLNRPVLRRWNGVSWTLVG